MRWLHVNWYIRVFVQGFSSFVTYWGHGKSRGQRPVQRGRKEWMKPKKPKTPGKKLKPEISLANPLPRITCSVICGCRRPGPFLWTISVEQQQQVQVQRKPSLVEWLWWPWWAWPIWVDTLIGRAMATRHTCVRGELSAESNVRVIHSSLEEDHTSEEVSFPDRAEG